MSSMTRDGIRNKLVVILSVSSGIKAAKYEEHS
jgi:hypothetical protein